MPTLHSFRGDPARNDDHLPEPLTIIFDERVPALDRAALNENHDAFMLRWQGFYATAAAAIVDAMSGQLPGGLLDAIFADLARRKASVFRVVAPSQWRATPPEALTLAAEDVAAHLDAWEGLLREHLAHLPPRPPCDEERDPDDRPSYIEHEIRVLVRDGAALRKAIAAAKAGAS